MVPRVGSAVTPLEGNENTDFFFEKQRRTIRGERRGEEKKRKMLEPKEGEGMDVEV